MINRFFFLFSTVGLLCGSTSVVFSSDSFNPHTSHTPIELKPAFSDLGNSYKTASVCFIGGKEGCGDTAFYRVDKTNGDGNFDVNTANQCIQEGFEKTSCSLPYYLNGQCPYNPRYYSGCIKDVARTCRDLGYEYSYCGPGEIADTSCPYGNFVRCKCNPCEGYNYTYPDTIEQGYSSGGECLSCSTLKYKRTENSCSGFMTCECGGEIGAAVCYSGTVKKYNICKACCENKCTLSSCPAGHTCEYEACSNKYCDNGCAAGYSDMCALSASGSCTQMGYKRQSCSGESVSCPYNQSYVFCP